MRTINFLAAAILFCVSCAHAEEWQKFASNNGDLSIHAYFNPASVKLSKGDIIDVSVKSFYFTKDKPEGIYDIIMDTRINCKENLELITKADVHYKDNSKPAHSVLEGKPEWKKIIPGLPLAKLSNLLCPPEYSQTTNKTELPATPPAPVK